MKVSIKSINSHHLFLYLPDCRRLNDSDKKRRPSNKAVFSFAYFFPVMQENKEVSLVQVPFQITSGSKMLLLARYHKKELFQNFLHQIELIRVV